MSAPAEVTVALCLCGHAERRHGDEYGCDNSACGCTVFRVDDGSRRPVIPSPVAAVLPPQAAATDPVAEPLVCDCGRSFPTRHGLAVHRARQHKPAPDYAAIGADIDTERGIEPERVEVGDADTDEPPAQRLPLYPEPSAAFTNAEAAWERMAVMRLDYFDLLFDAARANISWALLDRIERLLDKIEQEWREWLIGQNA